MPSTFTQSHRGGSGPPLVLVHGFTDTWRTWDLLLSRLETRFDVLAVTLPGHAGGPDIIGSIDVRTMADGVAATMDAAGFDTARIVGNSLGGFVALQLAERGRADSVIALAPAGGWANDDDSLSTMAFFETQQQLVVKAAAHADEIAATPEERRQATRFYVEDPQHIPPDLVAHQLRGAANCPAAMELVAYARREGWQLDAERVRCPVKVVWGTRDRLLPWPSAAVRFRQEWLPQAEWIELTGLGTAPNSRSRRRPPG